MTKLHPKVRLVKCPRCAEILPEPEQVPLYTCGGCGTVLQAKHYRSSNKATGLASHEHDVVQSNGFGHGRDEGESTSSSRRSSSGEQPSAQSNGRDHNAIENCDSELIELVNSDILTLLSEESSFLKNKENGEINNADDSAFREKEESVELTMENAAIEDDGGQDKELNGITVENYAEESYTRKEPRVLPNHESLQYDIAFDNQKQVECGNPVEEAFMLNESPDIEKQTELAPESRAELDGSDHDITGETRKVHLVGMLSCEDKPREGAESGKEGSYGKDQNDSVECTTEQLESVKLLSEAPLSTESAQYGSKSVDNVTETSRQKSDNSDDCAVSGSEQPRSIDKPGASEPVDAHREVCSSLKAVPRSPAKISLAYYEGSVFSCDGNDDPAPGQPGHGDAEESPEWDNLPSERLNYRRNSGIQTQPKSSSSLLLDEKLKSGMVEEEEPVEENGFLLRNRTTRPNRDSFMPRDLHYQRNSQAVYETGSSSSYVRDETLPSHWMSHHPYKNEGPEPWLRKTYTVQRNVGRRRFPEAVACDENKFLPPMYYNYETSVSGEFFQRSKYHAYVDRRRSAESWSQSGILPRIPYSGEVFNGRYQIRDPYMHRHPDDLRWSAQLPPPAACCRQGLCKWDSHDSYLTSQQQYVDPDSYGWAHDAISLSDDQRHKDPIMRRLYMREKRQAVKTHLRPLAGGAPFIACHLCFNVLELPRDFLLPRRRRRRRTRTHRLKCGSCSSILAFSLEKECYLVPEETNVNENINLASSSQVGRSRKSSLTTRETQGPDANGRELLSHDSFGVPGTEKRKLTPRNSRNGEKIEGLQEAEGSPIPDRQMRVTWRPSARSKSPLHRLMGYSSPQDLVTGHDP